MQLMARNGVIARKGYGKASIVIQERQCIACWASLLGVDRVQGSHAQGGELASVM